MTDKTVFNMDCCRNCIYQAYVIHGDLCYCFRNPSKPVICSDDEGYCQNIQYRFVEQPAKTDVWYEYAGTLLRCGNCGYEYTDRIECADYCGNCGAKMLYIVGEMKWDEVKDYGQA